MEQFLKKTQITMIPYPTYFENVADRIHFVESWEKFGKKYHFYKRVELWCEGPNKYENPLKF